MSVERFVPVTKPIPGLAYHGWGLAQAVDALRAYDGGTTDSGVHDPPLKGAVRDYLNGLPPGDRRVVLARLARDWVSESRLAQGYGVEDLGELLEWIDEIGVDTRG